MEDENKKSFIILIHGDMEVSTKKLAWCVGVKDVSPCSPDTAVKYTGYLVGGISPFGTRKDMPVYMEETILDYKKIYINGGKRKFLVGLNPEKMKRILKITLVRAGI